MSEEWRRKKFYGPRVLIPVDEVLDSAFGDCLVCLTGGQLNLVRNLLEYATRRTTFVSEYHPQFYMTPTTEEWDALQAVVAELERNLMNCDQFTADIAEILAWLRSQGSLSAGPFTADEAEAFPYDDVVGDDELTPAEAAACAVAQLWFEWGYQVITEHVLPATRFGFDYLVPAVTAFIVGAIGGPPAVLGVYVVAELIQELLEVLYDGAETNLVNWMTTNKQDIVCSLYPQLWAGGDASAIWAVTKAAIITPAEDISAGDKLILSLFMGSWAGSNALRAFNAATEWATSNVIADYCDACDVIYDLDWDYVFPPCPGDDWVLGSEKSLCTDGYPNVWGVGGYAKTINLEGLAGQTWDITLYAKFKSDTVGNGSRCGTLYLEAWTGSWTSALSLPLISGGAGVWVEAEAYRLAYSPAWTLWRLYLYPYGAGTSGQCVLQRGRMGADNV